MIIFALQILGLSCYLDSLRNRSSRHETRDGRLSEHANLSRRLRAYTPGHNAVHKMTTRYAEIAGGTQRY